MNVRLDQPMPRYRVEARGASYSLEEFCEKFEVNLLRAKLLLTEELRLTVITAETLLRKMKEVYETQI